MRMSINGVYGTHPIDSKSCRNFVVRNSLAGDSSVQYLFTIVISYVALRYHFLKLFNRLGQQSCESDSSLDVTCTLQ